MRVFVTKTKERDKAKHLYKLTQEVFSEEGAMFRDGDVYYIVVLGRFFDDKDVDRLLKTGFTEVSQAEVEEIEKWLR